MQIATKIFSASLKFYFYLYIDCQSNEFNLSTSAAYTRVLTVLWLQ